VTLQDVAQTLEEKIVSASRVSVVIPTYNRAELLGYTLATLAKQTLPTDRFEVLVCDDGSTDDTAAVVDRYRDHLDITRLFHEHDGFGAGRSRNEGISRATGDVCVLLDSGALVHSGCLAAHLDNHATAGGPYAVIGYVYGYSVDEDDTTGIEAQIDVNDVDGTVERMTAKGLYPDIRDEFYLRYHDDFADLPAPWVMFWTANVSVPTALLRQVGMFDEQFRTWGGEDLDIAFRLFESGARFVVNRAACSVEYPHPRNFEAGLEMSRTNHRLMIPKYRSPVIPLLMALPTINPFNINDVIVALDLDTTPGRPESA
jgi:glycosyltransferase involved in cell wall biosynthesis